MTDITIAQGLSWLKTLRDRHYELIALRDKNSTTSRRRWGETKDMVETPVYDVKKLDKTVNRLALEIRKLDDAIKNTNAKTSVEGYNKDIDILGELE